MELQHVRKASYHGHCLNDAHLSMINKKVGEEVHHHHGQLKRSHSMAFMPASPQAAAEAPAQPPLNAADLAEFIKKRLNNTEVVLLPKIDRSARLKPKVATLWAGIKSCHDFTFPDANTVRCRRLTSDAKHTGVVEQFAPDRKRRGSVSSGDGDEDMMDDS